MDDARPQFDALETRPIMRLHPAAPGYPLVALALLAVALPAPAAAPPKPAPHKKAAKRASARARKPATPGGVPEGWTTFRSPEGGFTVFMPVDPAARTLAVPTAGGTLVMHEYKCEMIGYACALIYGDVPPGQLQAVSPERLLNAAENGSFEGEPDANWLSDRDIEIAGNPGREIVTAGPGERRTILRFFNSGDRLYALEAARAYADDADHKKAMDTFLNSFKLLPAGQK